MTALINEQWKKANIIMEGDDKKITMPLITEPALVMGTLAFNNQKLFGFSLFYSPSITNVSLNIPLAEIPMGVIMLNINHSQKNRMQIEILNNFKFAYQPLINIYFQNVPIIK